MVAWRKVSIPDAGDLGFHRERVPATHEDLSGGRQRRQLWCAGQEIVPTLGTKGRTIIADTDEPAFAESTSRTPTAVQAVLILNALAEHASEGASVRGVADSISTSRSAAHRILQALAEEGFAIQDRHGRYAVGPRLVQLAARVLADSTWLGAAEEVMARLVDEVGETVYLAMFVPSERYATFVHRVECSQPLRYVQPIGARIPLHAGAAGKAILAASGLEPAEGELERYTDNTLYDAAALRKELAAIREHGYATSIEERVLGASGVAAPVRSRAGVIGALTITVPTSRIPAKGLETLGPTVVRYADELSSVITASGASRF